MKSQNTTSHQARDTSFSSAGTSRDIPLSDKKKYKSPDLIVYGEVKTSISAVGGYGNPDGFFGSRDAA